MQIIRPNEENSRPMIERKNLMFKRHTNTDLIYLNPSPDYCEADYERKHFNLRNKCQRHQTNIINLRWNFGHTQSTLQ